MSIQDIAILCIVRDRFGDSLPLDMDSVEIFRRNPSPIPDFQHFQRATVGKYNFVTVRSFVAPRNALGFEGEDLRGSSVVDDDPVSVIRPPDIKEILEHLLGQMVIIHEVPSVVKHLINGYTIFPSKATA